MDRMTDCDSRENGGLLFYDKEIDSRITCSDEFFSLSDAILNKNLFVILDEDIRIDNNWKSIGNSIVFLYNTHALVIVSFLSNSTRSHMLFSRFWSTSRKTRLLLCCFCMLGQIEWAVACKVPWNMARVLYVRVCRCVRVCLYAWLWTGL